MDKTKNRSTGVKGSAGHSRMAEGRGDTRVHPEDMESVRGHERVGEVTWDLVEETTILINPDADSMGSRG